MGRRFVHIQKRPIYIVIGVVALVLVLLIGAWEASRPVNLPLQGELELEEIDVSAKVPGRIKTILVEEGDTVTIGTPLIEMDSPEIDAKVKEAEAGQKAANALVEKAENGARHQEVEMAKETWKRAEAGAVLARKSYHRVENLAAEGLLSMQKKDEVYAQMVNATNQAAAAKAQYNMALEGAREEDKKAAKAQAERVSGLVEEAHVALSESNLKSPVSGVIDKVIAKKGEIVPQGAPIVTIAQPHDQKLYINVKETELKYFALGKVFTGEVPALGKGKIKFKVINSRLLPDFATWRPTRDDNGFDVKTFAITARPLQPIQYARSGMSVLIDEE